jgi:hypothetical protein
MTSLTIKMLEEEIRQLMSKPYATILRESFWWLTDIPLAM